MQDKEFTITWRFYNSSLNHKTQIVAWSADEAWEIIRGNAPTKLIKERMILVRWDIT